MSALAVDFCPTPKKVSYNSRTGAVKGRNSRRNKGRRMTPYLCPCKKWHLRTTGIWVKEYKWLQAK